MDLFIKVRDSNVEIASEIAKTLLTTHSPECFPNLNYNDMLEQLQCEESYVIEASYEKRETYKGKVFEEDNKKFIYSGLATEVMQNGLTRTVYTYYVQTYTVDYVKKELQFVYLKDIGNK